ncbi:MAG TPA: DNA-binding protein [Candidatus Moranbacteria bacterium]|nr:DNA-binding protein [Candidatus Moranbacteria bacterium]
MTKQKSLEIIPDERIVGKIYFIRGEKVMLDRDLAELYRVTTGNLNKAVKRNNDRFPDDFMFQLNKQEADMFLRFQNGTLKRGRGQHLKYLPYVFTEQGVAMLSSVLKSNMAVQVNIQIMRTFAKMRRLLASNKELAEKIERMEKKYDENFKIIFKVISKFMTTDPKDAEPKIRGFEERKKIK